MDLLELKKEQLKLAPKIVLKDNFTRIKTIGGIDCVAVGQKLLACVVICEFPSLKILEAKTYCLDNPLPYRPAFEAYREMPAMIEAYNQVQQEPDVLLVDGAGILHPRRLGLASHLGLALNRATIGVSDSLPIGRVEKGKIFLGTDVVGFEITTREFSNPIYVSPGHLVSLGTVLNLIGQLIRQPHKLPEPLYLAHKMAKRKVKMEQRNGEIISSIELTGVAT